MVSGDSDKGVSVRTMAIVSMALTAVLCVCMMVVSSQVDSTGLELQDVTERYIQCERAASEMLSASDYLSSQARSFVLTEERDYLQNYFEEVHVEHRRERALQVLEANVGEGRAEELLEEALVGSYELQIQELHAIKIICLIGGIPQREVRELLDEVELPDEEMALSFPERRQLARELVTGDEYELRKTDIDQKVEGCIEELIIETSNRQQTLNDRLSQMLGFQFVLMVLILLTAIATIAMIVVLVLRPLRTYTTDIASGEDLRLDGCSELRYLASAYNEIAEENRNYQASLLYDAEHDPLTGLPNRSVYERLYGALGDAGALAIIDVDYFKRVNDDLGHEVGDEALRRVADVLRESFASADHVCRIGGDEFAALRCEAEPGDRDDLRDRIERARAALAGPLGCVPALTLSVGIAFAIDVPEGLSLYKAADLALYKVKERGRNGCEFYD